MTLAILALAALQAHEIGTTRAKVTFDPSGTYEILIAADGSAVVEKLEAVNGLTATPETNPTILTQKLKQYESTFLRRIKIHFDGVPVQEPPSVRYEVEAAKDANSAPAASILLKGAIPAGAKKFTWTYGWTFASYALTFHSTVAGAPVRATEWVEGGQPSAAFALNTLPAAPSRWSVAKQYLTLGFTHIVPLGVDHVLFVLGLYLLSSRPRAVLMQVTAFTIAHSITLGLSLYGVVRVPAAIVEPLIAISIAYVAIENIFLRELKAWRVALVFAFGLLHGLGFAGALSEVGLPRAEFVTALLTFNLGVEAGQLAVIAAAFLLVGWWHSERIWYRTRIVIPASAAIACMAVYWTFERLLP